MFNTKNMFNMFFKEALNVYCYGSFVYGTYKEGVSDKDYIFVMPDDFDYQEEQIELDNMHINFFKLSKWQNDIENNKIVPLECSFLSSAFILKETCPISIVINKENVRENISKVASNSYVKCKKKLIVNKDFSPRIGKKSLWHSLRLLMFGIQIMKYGKIVNYSEANYLYNEIVNNENNNWEYYKEKYQPLYNNLKTKFKLSQLEK